MTTQYSAASSLAGKNEIATHTKDQAAQKTTQALLHINFKYTPIASQQKDCNE